MSQPTPNHAVSTKEKTFSAYTASQGKAYAQIRRDYHSSVYQTILDQHSSTGGQFTALLDIGCGPGTVTSNFAPHFTSAIGLDPSAGMIDTARSLGGIKSNSTPIQYEISTAESLGSNLSPPIADSSIDLITAANAAHWFDMGPFWHSAARILKPGGSVAIWTSGSLYPHPDMPCASKIQDLMDTVQESHLSAFEEPGNVLVRNGYRDLVLPWTMTPAVAEFGESTFFRREWVLGEQFFKGEQEADLNTYEMMMGTASAVTRWRQANPDKVGTEEDVVRVLRRGMERLLREAGVKEGEEKVKGSARGVVLVIKKKQTGL